MTGLEESLRVIHLKLLTTLPIGSFPQFVSFLSPGCRPAAGLCVAARQEIL